MSTTLHLMVQFNRGADVPIDERKWDFKNEVSTSVIPFLHLLGLNPETEAGTVGKLIDSAGNHKFLRQVSIRILHDYMDKLLAGSTARILFVPESRFVENGKVDVIKMRFVQILSQAIAYLSETDDDGFVYHVRVQWS